MRPETMLALEQELWNALSPCGQAIRRATCHALIYAGHGKNVFFVASQFARRKIVASGNVCRDSRLRRTPKALASEICAAGSRPVR
jgi:hypothetical protein